MRELGRFAEAETLLAKPFSEELTQAAAIVSDFTQQKIQDVREMKFQ